MTDEKKYGIVIKNCKAWKKDGIKLLEMCGFSKEKAEGIMQSLPYTLTLDTEKQRNEMFKKLQQLFDASIIEGKEERI